MRKNGFVCQNSLRCFGTLPLNIWQVQYCVNEIVKGEEKTLHCTACVFSPRKEMWNKQEVKFYRIMEWTFFSFLCCFTLTNAFVYMCGQFCYDMRPYRITDLAYGGQPFSMSSITSIDY